MTADRSPEAYDDWQQSNPSRPGVDAGRLWAGGVATAAVAALIAVVGILITRGIFHIPVLAPKGSGTWGNANTATYALAAFGFGLLATALIHGLLLATPAPFVFFGWIIGLCVLAGVVAPFGADGDLAPKITTAFINLIIGIAVWSLTISTAKRSLR